MGLGEGAHRVHVEGVLALARGGGAQLCLGHVRLLVDLVRGRLGVGVRVRVRARVRG